MYLSEFRLNARPLAAACIGMATGSALAHYTASLFGPALISEFGWSRADYALLGSLSLVNLLLTPLVGRFIDRFGTRVGATTGFAALTLSYVALSQFNGSLGLFFAITLLQNTAGGLTATLVFCRLTVQHFDRARGIALALIMTVAPLSGAVLAPWLGGIIAGQGWRAAYIALACICAAGGTAAVLGMSSQREDQETGTAARRLSFVDAMGFLRNRLLVLIIAGTFLINIPAVFASSQLTLVAVDAGATLEAAAWMVSLYAIGVVVGRFLCGLALDRIEPHLVAGIGLGLPAVGYMLFAAQPNTLLVLYAAVAIIGLAQGAEGDIGAYLISREFDLAHFSLLLSLMTAALGASTAAGALLLSVTLRAWESYQPYLLVCAVATILGAICFGLTGRGRGAMPSSIIARSPR